MRAQIKAIFVALMGLVLAACSPAALLNGLLVPNSGYSVKRDIAYGGDPRQKLDIYIPDGLKAPAPVILFLYGGSWQMGSKNIYKFLGQAFASKGIVTVVADYRLYPEVKYPTFVQDTARAFKFVHGAISQYGGDPGRIFLAGHSAGAYNVVLLDSDLHYLKDAGVDPAWIRGVIGISGPYDFLPLKDPALIEIFGGANVEATQPIHYVDGKRAPMLLVTGTDDDTVKPKNSANMVAKLRSFGSDAELKAYPGVGHIGIMVSLAPGFRGNTSLREDIANFVQSH
jgi:acetyl esterase/lipase